MRRIFAMILVALSGCQPSHDTALAETERSQAGTLRQTETPQRLHAFGGTLTGKDEGEWGGEVKFQEQDGTSYTVVADNSHGIFEMPYGVVALTGLAHLGSNRGAVHLLTRLPGKRVTARQLMQLPGAPCDVIRTDDRITMRISSWHRNAVSGTVTPQQYTCHALLSDQHLVQYKCPTPEPEICFG